MLDEWIPKIGGVEIHQWASWGDGNMTCFDLISNFTEIGYNSGYQDGMILAFFLSAVAFFIYRFAFVGKKGEKE